MRRTLLIVDDHEEFRRSARVLLEGQGFDVVGEAEDGAGGLEQTVKLSPEVVLIDIQLPDTDGFLLAERIAALPDPPAIVLVSSREAAAYGPKLADARARGFLAKSDLSGDSLAQLVS